MPRYRYTGDGQFRDHANDRVVEAGEVVELVERIGNPHKALELVEEATGEGSTEPAIMPFVPLDLTVGELRDRVADIDDPEVLRQLRDAEADQENRDTAIEAIEGRINAVSE